MGNKILEKEIVEHQDSVGIIALDKKDNIILVEQFRIATRDNLLEIPAGKIENGETPDNAALREMNEEIGLSGKLTPLFRCYLAPGTIPRKCTFFSHQNSSYQKSDCHRMKMKKLRLEE